MEFNVPRGTKDILPTDVDIWLYIEKKLRSLSRRYAFGEIRTPIFEHTEVFSRSVGEDTDIVSKEMYSFKDRGERDITLRPEGTAAVVRAYLENNFDALPKPVKLFYYGPMFRYDRPQAGRYRQFHQFGIELFGSDNHAADVEVIAFVMDFLEEINLKNIELHINSVGCPECRKSYRDKLLKYLDPFIEKMCLNCRDRFKTNPLRVLDCKKKSCQDLFAGVPEITESICEECSSHFERVKELLAFLNIGYVVNPRLVRGLDYYTRTAFEFVTGELGSQSAIGGGGRYDKLIEVFGGEPTPAVGLALGLERIILLLSQQNSFLREDPVKKVFLIADSHSRLAAVMKIAGELRKKGVSAEVDYVERSLKARMKYAGKKGFSHVVILGEKEEQAGKLMLKDMNQGEQELVTPGQIIEKMQLELLI